MRLGLVLSEGFSPGMLKFQSGTIQELRVQPRIACNGLEFIQIEAGATLVSRLRFFRLQLGGPLQ